MSPKTSLKKTVPAWYLTQDEWVEKAKECGLVGHEHVIAELYFDYIAYMSGMHFKDCPVTARVLAGPTGTGKTKLVQTLAHMLHGDPRKVLRIDCAEYQHNHDVAKLVGCLVPDSPVTMYDGTTKKIVDIKIGDKVISGFGNVRTVLDTYEYDYKGHVAKVDLAFNTHQLTLTPEHKIWAIKASRKDGKRIRNLRLQYDKAKLSYIPVSELTKGDIVVCPRFKTTNNSNKILDLAEYARNKAGIEVTDTQIVTRQVKFVNRLINVDKFFMRLAGYYVAEGGFSGNRFSLCFGTNAVKSEATNDALTLLPKVFGNECEFTIEDRTERNSNRLWFSSAPVVELLKDLFGDHTLNKKIPSWFLELSDDLLYEFLDAAFAGDGGKSVPRRIDYSTSSSQLAQQIRTLLHKLGYAVQIQHQTNGEWSDRYRLYIAGPQIVSLCNKLPMVGKYIDLQLDKSIPFIQRQSFVDDDYVYYRINSVTFEEYDGKVYDISVEEDVNYVVDVSIKNSPPGYLGHRETTPLLSMSALNNLRSERTDVSIVLFDEFEKAHDSLYRLLLGVLDYGKMTMGDNISVVFNKTMVFFTTNIGVKVRANSIGLEKTPPPESSKKTVLVELKKRFSAEFLNRLGGDSQIHYLDLITKDQLKEIAKLELEKLSAALYKALRVFIASIDDKVFDFILDTSQASEYAGRGIEKVIDKVIKPAIIQYVIENRPVTPIALEKTAITLNYNEGLVVEAESYA